MSTTEIRTPGPRPEGGDGLVARRGDLPGLPAQLRGRQRRRHRRPGGRPLATPLPRRPRRRRPVVHALVPVPHGRRRLRRRRLPGDRPRVRRPRPGRGADPGGHGTRHPHDHRRGAQPRLRPARVVPGGAGRRTGRSGAGAVLVPGRAGSVGRAATQRLGVGVRRRGLDPRHLAGRDAGAVVPPSVRIWAARPQLGASRRARGACRDPAVLVRPRGGRHPDRQRRPPRQGPAPARSRRGGGRRPCPRTAPVRRPRRPAGDLPRVARDRRDLRPRPGADR